MGKGLFELRPFLNRLLKAGAWPIAVDARWANSSQQPLKPCTLGNVGRHLLTQTSHVGNGNRFFGDVTAWANKYELCRSTTVLAVCETAGLSDDVSLLGISKGGLDLTRAALAYPDLFSQLVLIVPVGAAQSEEPERAFVKNGLRRSTQVLTARAIREGALVGVAGSCFYAASNPARIKREKKYMLASNLWEMLDLLHERAPGIEQSMFVAKGDLVVPYAQCEERARLSPHVRPFPTEGQHFIYYDPDFQDRVAERIMQRGPSRQSAVTSHN